MVEAGRKLSGGELPDTGYGWAAVWNDTGRIGGPVFAALEVAGGLGAAVISKPDRIGANDMVAQPGRALIHRQLEQVEYGELEAKRTNPHVLRIDREFILADARQHFSTLINTIYGTK
jgi:hypothetical protein